MATRISLVRSIRLREQREQIGELTSPFYRELVDLETKCLVQLSNIALTAHRPQIALNSITKAQTLNRDQRPEILEELASVLWTMHEPQLAFQYLFSIVQRAGQTIEHEDARTALLLARLVRHNLLRRTLL